VAFPPVGGILAGALALTGLFQLFSRAEGIAKIRDFKLLPEMTEKFMKVLNMTISTFGRFLKPIFSIFESLAQWISPLFEVSRYMKLFTEVLYQFTLAISYLQAFSSGLLEVYRYLFLNLWDWIKHFGSMIGDSIGELFSGSLLDPVFSLFDKMGISIKSYFLENVAQPISTMFQDAKGLLPDIFSPVTDIFTTEFDRIMNENLASLKSPDGPIQNMITNIGKVEIKNDFKEQLEPDRIAFTLVEQLKRVAQNPGQGGRSFSGGLVK
jgi:hypothetical protein